MEHPEQKGFEELGFKQQLKNVIKYLELFSLSFKTFFLLSLIC